MTNDWIGYEPVTSEFTASGVFNVSYAANQARQRLWPGLYGAKTRALFNFADTSDAKGHAVSVYGNSYVSGGKLQLDGSGDYIAFSNYENDLIVNNEDLAIDVLAKLNGASAGTSYPCLFALYDGSTLIAIRYVDGGWGSYANRLSLQLDGTTGGQLGGAGWSSTSAPTKTDASNTDHWYSISRVSGVWNVYFDGALKFQCNQMGPSNNSPRKLIIGSIELAAGVHNWGVNGSGLATISALRVCIGTNLGYTGSSISLPSDPLTEI